MAIPWNEFHTYLIYVVFGYSLLYPVVLLCLKILNLTHPVQRLQLFLTAFLAPPVGFVAYHTVFTKRCQAGLLPSGAGGESLHYLCAVSGTLLNLVLPLLGILFVLALLKLIAGYLLISRLRRKAVAPPEEITARVGSILKKRCSAMGIVAPEIIYCYRRRFTAYTAGLFKPVLVLNGTLATGLSAGELDAVLTHELVHVRRRDNLKGWLLNLLRDITFFNPLSSLLLNRCLHEIEHLCDREASAITGQAPGVYAATLLKVCKILLAQQPLQAGPVSAFSGARNGLEYRVSSLLRADGDRSVMPALPYYAMLAAIFCGSLVFLGLIC